MRVTHGIGNMLEDGIRNSQYLMIPITKNLVAFLDQKLSPVLISRGLTHMLAPIQFNH